MRHAGSTIMTTALKVRQAELEEHVKGQRDHRSPGEKNGSQGPKPAFPEQRVGRTAALT